MTAQIIATLQQKGDAGKSAMIQCLAGYLARDKARVLIIDTDPQENCVQWATKSDVESVDVLPLLDESKLIPVCRVEAEAYDVILLDTAGYDSKMATYAMNVADLILIPTGASESTIIGAGKTYEHVLATTSNHARPPRAFWVIWGIKRHTAVAQHAREVIRSSNHPIIPAPVGDLVGFEAMSWEGGLPNRVAMMAVRDFVAEMQMMGLLDYYADARGGAQARAA